MLSHHEVSQATKIKMGNLPAKGKSLVKKMICFYFWNRSVSLCCAILCTPHSISLGFRRTFRKSWQTFKVNQITFSFSDSLWIYYCSFWIHCSPKARSRAHTNCWISCLTVYLQNILATCSSSNLVQNNIYVYIFSAFPEHVIFLQTHWSS